MNRREALQWFALGAIEASGFAGVAEAATVETPNPATVAGHVALAGSGVALQAVRGPEEMTRRDAAPAAAVTLARTGLAASRMLRCL